MVTVVDHGLAAVLAADGAGRSGALLLMLIIGVGAGMMLQRFTRSHRDLKAAKVFAKAAARTHWRRTVPRMMLWGLVAVCAVIALFRA